MSGTHDPKRKDVIETDIPQPEVSGGRQLPTVRIFLLTVSVSLMAVTAARAQSAYLQKGQSGWEVSGEFSSGQGLESGSVTAGYSSRGIIDAVVTLSRLSFPNPYPLDFVVAGRRVTGSAFSMMFSAHVVKQDRQTYPLSISLSAGCYMGSFSLPGSQNALEMSVENGYMSYGGTIYRDIHLSSNFFIQPALSYFYSEGFGGVGETYYRPQVGNDYVRSFITGVSFAMRIPGSETLVIEPAFTSSRGKNFLSIDAGVVVGVGGDEVMVE